MGRHHYVAEESWAVIDLDTNEGRVLVRENWTYNFDLWAGVTASWSYDEKKQFHTTVDRQIWSAWSFRVGLWVTGTSDFAKRFRRQKVSVNFDVKWWLVEATRHWHVTVWKMPPGTAATVHRSFVDVPRQRIELNTADITPRSAGNDAGRATMNFQTIPHEFGHAMKLPTGYTANPDEYKAGSPHLADTNSMMNIGTELRVRHLAATVDALNRLAVRAPVLHDSQFAVASIL